jgi:hypothetical protein
MAISTPTDLVNRARDRLVTQFRGTTTHRGILDLFSAQAQDLDTALQQLAALPNIAQRSGVVLDLLGKVLGVERGNASDAQYRLFLSAQVLVNRSSGTVPELIQILETAFAGAAALAILDRPPAALEVLLSSPALADATPYLRMLRAAKAGGVDAVLRFVQSPVLTTDAFVFQGGNGISFTYEGDTDGGLTESDQIIVPIDDLAAVSLNGRLLSQGPGYVDLFDLGYTPNVYVETCRYLAIEGYMGGMWWIWLDASLPTQTYPSGARFILNPDAQGMTHATR